VKINVKMYSIYIELDGECMGLIKIN
jgi:hypothetical protein